MQKEIIAPDNVAKARGYSHAIKVGNTIYVAGQVGVDIEGKVVGNDIASQCEQAYENLKRVLAAAGAEMTDIVKLLYFVKNVNDMAQTRDARRKYFGDHFPPATLVQIVSLASPDLLLEVEAVAVIG